MYKFSDFSCKVLFFDSHILPRKDYCLFIVWEASNNTLLRLFRLQNRVARLILDVCNDTSSAIVFRQLKWMSVFQSIFIRNVFCYLILQMI